MPTVSEQFINSINENVFFREFTFDNKDFLDANSKQKVELADNIVWIDDLLFIIEIKERNKSESSSTVEKWFQNKVINKAVKQIKNTHKYLNSYSNLTITNNKGHYRNLAESVNADRYSLICYMPEDNFEDNLRFRKFYESSEVGLIHLFHAEDYMWICKYLITPAEIEEYLIFRQALYSDQREIINQLPEQYVLGHFLKTLDTSHIEPEYITNIQKFVREEIREFDVSHIIKQFEDKIVFGNEETQYYYILQELALLNRADLKHFKIRFERTFEMAKQQKLELPYRMYVPRTDCAFVFMPIRRCDNEHWRQALNNITELHKYDSQAYRCVGVTMCYHEDQMVDICWSYLEGEHVQHDEFDKILNEDSPFREVKVKPYDNRYGF